MIKIPLETYLPGVSRLAYGCMNLGGAEGDSESEAVQQLNHAVDAALETGINFFDHADIYNAGKAENLFGKMLEQRPSLRESIYLQSKCGIRFEDHQGPTRYDFSQQWIEASVDGILSRLRTDYIDILVLHRPDPLMDGDEVAETFKSLRKSGKVKFFGVSNVHRDQLAFLQSYLDAPLVANQIELSLQQCGFVDEAIYAGNPRGADVNFEAGTLEYCQKNLVQVQAWGSLCQGLFSGKNINSEPQNIRNTATLVASLAEKYRTNKEAIVLAWLFRHPAKIQPIIGTVNPQRIRACGDAEKIELSRGDWYALYVAVRGEHLP